VQFAATPDPATKSAGNLDITSVIVYLEDIDNAEIIGAVHARRAPMIPDTGSPRFCSHDLRHDTRDAARRAKRYSCCTHSDCWSSSNSAASGRSNRCAKTAPLPRSRSLILRSWSSSQATVSSRSIEMLAR
jgi:hypothetical protein